MSTGVVGVAATVVALLLGTAGPATAQGALVDAEDCLTGQNDFDDYAALSSVGTTDYTLYCGDPEQ